MEERRERIKGLYELMAMMDEEGMDIFDIVADSIKIGFRLGVDAAARKKEEEEKERDPA